MPLRFTMLLVLTKAFLRSPAPRATRRVVARAATKSTNGGEWALPDGWRAALGDELESDRFRDLRAFVAAERASQTVYPPPEQTLRALRSVDLERVRVCVVGQDPYDTGQHSMPLQRECSARAFRNQHPRFESAPRDDRSSKNQSKRVENGRERSL